MPFAEFTKNGKGVYVLNRTSNPGAKDFQNLTTIANLDEFIEAFEGKVMDANQPQRIDPHAMAALLKQTIDWKAQPLFMAVAEKIIEWSNDNKGVGAVVGATSIPELEKIVGIYSGQDIPLLIPGVGGQVGSATEVMQRLKNANYDLSLVRINSSSGITHPWKTSDKAPKDYANAVVENLKRLNEEIAYR
jgi:orotidine-5'-phosphate decarboxylase